jgi:branched-chain amino acid aminotransferase
MNLVWHDGALSRDGKIELPADNRGYALGDGLFETMLMAGGEVEALEAHLARLSRSAARLDLKFREDDARTAVAEVSVLTGSTPHVLRLRLLRGEPAILLATTTAFDAGFIGKPARLITATLRRNPHSLASTHKTLSYVDSTAAMREAEEAGADGALMLNTAGEVASAAVANVFLLKGRDLITPGSNQGILPGTTRARLLRAAATLGLNAIERVVQPMELADADAVFLTNALRLVTPVTHLDGAALGTRDINFILDHLMPHALKETTS